MSIKISTYSYSKGRGKGLLALREDLKPGAQGEASIEPPLDSDCDNTSESVLLFTTSDRFYK